MGAFTIKELTGDRRTIELEGRAAPFKPYRLSGGHRVDLTRPPGSPNATAQLVGPDEDTTSINGRWSDRYLGRAAAFGDTPIAVVDGIAASTCRELVALIDDVRVQGQLLEVTWDATLRIGFMTKFVQEWQRGEVVEWEMEFSWVGRGEPEDAAVFPAVTPVAEVVSSLSLSDLLGLTDALAAFRGLAEFLDVVVSALQQAAQLLDDMLSMVDLVATAIATPFELIAAVASLAKAFAFGLQEAIENAIGKITKAFEDMLAEFSSDSEGQAASGGAGSAIGADAGGTPSGWSAGSGAPAQPGTDAGGLDGEQGSWAQQGGGLGAGSASYGAGSGGSSISALLVPARSFSSAGKRMAAEAKANAVIRKMRMLRRRALRVAAEMEERLRTAGLRAVYVVRGDEDLRDVAMLYHGTQDAWRRIAAYNGLDGSELQPRQVVKIPKEDVA